MPQPCHKLVTRTESQLPAYNLVQTMQGYTSYDMYIIGHDTMFIKQHYYCAVLCTKLMHTQELRHDLINQLLCSSYHQNSCMIISKLYYI